MNLQYFTIFFIWSTILIPILFSLIKRNFSITICLSLFVANVAFSLLAVDYLLIIQSVKDPGINPPTCPLHLEYLRLYTSFQLFRATFTEMFNQINQSTWQTHKDGFNNYYFASNFRFIWRSASLERWLVPHLPI